jgi:uncharacterized protein YecE (DUF72 family)
MTATPASLATAYVGSSGFSYRSWRGGFYPEGTRPRDFLRFYAEQLPSVELNTTFRSLPDEEQFLAWAAETPPDFRFAVKMTDRITHGRDLALLATFSERVRLLGDRLGPVLVQLGPNRPRDDGLLTLLLGSLDRELPCAFELRHPSWEAPEVAAALADHRVPRVNDPEGAAPFRYLRLREPPYNEPALRALAERLGTDLAGGVPVYAYFKHEDEPTAPHYAQQLLRLLRG